MAIEIIPKPKPKVSLFQNLAFILALLILIFSISGIFGLKLLIDKTQTQLSEFEKILAREITEEEKILEQKIQNYQKKVKDFSSLLARYQKKSQIFPFLEKLTHPKVWFSSFSFSSDLKLNLAGQTESFRTLGEQILILKNAKMIKEVELSEIKIGKRGKVNFSLSLLIDPQILK